MGRGRFDAVPGTPPDELEPAESSDFWEVTMTERSGSKVSSLCSPLVKSHSSVTPARYFSDPRSGSSVERILTSRSCSSD